MQATDLQVIKDIPGYKVILKTVLKSQIQQLVEQLADHTGEESVILTASVSDGSLSHLGSDAGKVFLEDHDDIKSQFLGFCLKHHHKQKQLEKEKQQQQFQDPGGQMLMAPTTPTRFGPGPRPRFSPSRVHTAPRQTSPQSLSPCGIHPVSMTRASPQSVPRGGATNVRHEPYPGARPRKPLNFDPHSHKRLSQPSSSMKLPTDPGSAQKINTNLNEVIKIEAMDEDEDNAEKSRTEVRKSSVDSGQGDSGSSVPGTDPTATASPSQTALPPTPTDSSQSPAVKDDGSESSSSTITNEPAEVKYSDTLPPGGLSLDSDLSNLTGISSATASMDSSTSDSAAVDPNVNIKVEAVAESELDLEITGVEPGQMAQLDYGLMPNVQTRMGYSPSTSGGAQGDTTCESSQGYSVTDSRDLTGIKTHACRFCPKRFKNPNDLRRHERVHTGEKPYRCSICGKSFTTKGNLKTHMFIHLKINSM